MKARAVYIIVIAMVALAALCPAARAPKARIDMVYLPQPGGYRLFLFGTERALVCEEKNITVVEQGDAVNPLVLECKH